MVDRAGDPGACAREVIGIGGLKITSSTPRSEPGRGRRPPGNEETSRPVWLTRQVVSRPAPVGETSPSSYRRRARPPRRWYSCWPCAIEANERAVTGLRKKFRFNQRPEQLIAGVALEPPQALRLGGCQTKPRHFYELALDSLKHVVNTHGPSLSWGRTVLLVVQFPIPEQHPCLHPNSGRATSRLPPAMASKLLTSNPLLVRTQRRCRVLRRRRLVKNRLR
jgi:hypothetical protein